MITTQIELMFNHSVIKMPVADAVFSALRGPDHVSCELAKVLGATIMRRYLCSYMYGYQYTFLEAIGVKEFWKGISAKDEWITFWSALQKELGQIPDHYASHMVTAVRELRVSLIREGVISDRREDMKLDVDALELFHSFWTAIHGYTVGNLGSICNQQAHLNQVKWALQDLIVFIAQHSEWNAELQAFQTTYTY